MVATEQFPHRHLDVACELQTAEMGARLAEWHGIRRTHGLGTERIPGGARLWLDPAAWSAAHDLAQREAACCGFLDFELASDGDRARLDITSPTADAQPVIAHLVGLEAASE